MTPIGFAVRTGIAAAGVLIVTSAIAPRPAAAQGGIVCEYGPASYQRCCKQSYAKKSSLGASARANDIDACMGKKPKSKKPG